MDPHNVGDIDADAERDLLAPANIGLKLWAVETIMFSLCPDVR